MRFAIDHSQRKFFYTNGWLEVESLFIEKERADLLDQLQKILFDYPNHRFERGRYLSRSSPSLLALIRRKGLGELIYSLTDQRPLRLSNDHLFQNLTPNQKILLQQRMARQVGSACDLILSLSGDKAGGGVFFTPTGFDSLHFGRDEWYLLLSFSSQLLNEDFYPVIFK